MSRRYDIFTRTRRERLESVADGITPCIVSSDTTTLVWGFSALEWMETESSTEPGERELPVLIAPEDASLLALALRAEGRRDEYGWRERAAIRSICDDESIWPLVSSEGDPRPAIDRFTKLPVHLQNAVDSDVIDLKSAEAAAGISPDLYEALISLVKDRSFSRRRSFLMQFIEYRQGGERRDSEVLKELSHSEKPEEALRRLRFPVLAGMEDAVSRFYRTYLAGSGVRLDAPPSFEGDRYALSFTFRSESEFHRRLEALKRAEEGLSEILDVLF